MRIFVLLTITLTKKRKKMIIENKQQMLDKMPENNYEMALQNLLFSFSKTKLEQMRRVLNEINTTALYKTQLRALPWIDIFTAMTEAVKLNNPTNGKIDEIDI